MKGDLWAVGDIHGCLDKLEALVGKMDISGEDKVVFLGDYIDRGPDPAGVISFLLELSKKVPCVFLRGNHEDMYLRFLDGELGAGDLLIKNGGWSTLKSYKDEEPPEEHLDFLRGTLLHHLDGEILFVHAGLDPAVDTLEGQDPEKLMGIRNHYLLNSNHPWPFKIVSGHSIHRDPTFYAGGKRVVIDTGAFADKQGYGNLTAYNLTGNYFLIHSLSGNVSRVDAVDLL